MKNLVLLSAAAGLAAASPVQPEIDSIYNHPNIVSRSVNARAVPAKCNADNCARAVTGTDKGLAVQTAHKSDCSSFFLATYIPPTSTSTVTLTPHITQTVTQNVDITNTNTVFVTQTSYTESLQNQPAKRSASPNTGTIIIPSAVPTYASACSGIARFSSACACWGITASTTTLAAPTTVVTVTDATVTDVQTQTVTNTAIATAFQTSTVGYVDPIACGQQIRSPTQITYNIDCGQDGRYMGEQYRTGSSTQNTFTDCLNWVDANYPYSAVAYSLSTKTCGAYDTWYTTIRNANSDVVFAAHRF